MARLADVSGIVGVKDACCNIGQTAEAISRCHEDFVTLSGDDALILPIIALGGRGVISTTANVAPTEVGELVRACRAGDMVRARKLHYGLLPLMDALFCETNPIPLKTALGLMGLIDPEIRLPLTPISEDNRERIQVVLKELGHL
jgi:4-hydroxy-tetrahydrodipicolinate synthase